MAARRERAFAEARQDQHLAGGQPLVERVVGRDVVGGFVPGMAAGFADEQGGQPEAETRERDAEEERLGAQPVVLGDEPGGECGDRDRAVARGLVQTHGEPAPCGADEVDLHDDGGGPGEPLVDAE